MKLISGLHENLCDLAEPSALVADISSLNIIQHKIPAHLRYACRYWVHHFQHSDPNATHEDMNRILQFLKQNFLHWLEALSLIDEVSNGVLMIISLEEMLKVSSN